MMLTKGTSSGNDEWMLMKKYKIAGLDDYQNVELESADWSVLGDRADITVFQDHISELEPLARRLLPFDVLCIMRERTPMTAELMDRLPNQIGRASCRERV